MITIKDHLAQGIRHQLTKKYTSGRTIKPKGIVYHYTCGWTTSGDVNTLAIANNKVSAHLVVGRDGELIQCVPFNRRAWHAGPSKYKDLTDLNSHMIGIEISNIGWLRKRGQYYEDYYGNVIDANGNFVSSTRKAESAPKDWLHTTKYPILKPGTYVWEPYYAPQLAALDEITLALVKAYPSIKYAVSHEEIDTRRWKTDPGPAFPLERYRKIVSERSVSVPDDIVIPQPEKAPTKIGWGKRVSNWLRWPL